MLYFYERVLSKMDAGIFMTFEDRMFGAGIFSEMTWLYNKEKEIWEIDYEGVIMPVRTLEESRRLSIEKTRRRVYR